jgi:hypothetical protein
MKKFATMMIAASALTLALGIGAGLARAQAPNKDQPPGVPASAPSTSSTSAQAPAGSQPVTPPPASPPSIGPAPASSAPASDSAQQAGATAPAGGLIAPPTAGKGEIVFFRPSRLGGAALSFSVHEGKTGVGKLGNGSYFVLVADPGVHEYSIQSEATDNLRLEIDAGETYYVQQTIGMGIMMGRPHLTPSDQGTFAAKHLKLSTKTATDLQ